jgi:tRNA(Arg) A34 adenosine deaminase TadA
MSTLSHTDEAFLRAALALSQRSRDAGRHPFAAIVVDRHGAIIAEAMNDSLPPSGDPTRHAELVAAATAARVHGAAVCAGATLYTSAEPCAMCAGAIYWSGIGRVVYGLSETRLLAITGSHPENPTLSLPCRDVFARGQRSVEVLGPALEDEAAAIHAGFWSA